MSSEGMTWGEAGSKLSRFFRTAAGEAVDGVGRAVNLPTNARLYGRALVHDPRTIAEADFTPAELAEIARQAQLFGGDGRVEYAETSRDPNEPRPEVSRTPFVQDILARAGARYADSPYNSVGTTLGQYRVTPEGDGFRISDMYNFNPGGTRRQALGDALALLQKGDGYGFLRVLGEAIGPRGAQAFDVADGSASDTAEGMPVNLFVRRP